MNKKIGFNDTSYDLHHEWYDSQFPSEESRIKKIESFKNYSNSINEWLQNIFFNCIDPLFSDQKPKSWLTVGDAYGADANYILSKTDDRVVATDLNVEILSIAHKEKLINEFRSENAEKLSFEDNHFDYVLCKESYHHFPRPYMALYEMIRVCKKGIIIIEPQDPILQMPLLMGLTNILSTLRLNLINKIWKNRFSYEPVGNFVYKVSQREFEKLAAGLALPLVAVKKINPNFYFRGSEKEKADSSNLKFKKIRFKKFLLDTLSAVGIIPSQTLSIIVFKEYPSQVVIQSLRKDKYKLIEIAKNPYVATT